MTNGPLPVSCILKSSLSRSVQHLSHSCQCLHSDCLHLPCDVDYLTNAYMLSFETEHNEAPASLQDLVLVQTSFLFSCKCKLVSVRRTWFTQHKGPGKQGHIVADTKVSRFARTQHLLRTQILCPGRKKCFWFCSETFCVRNKCFPVCAAQETSWATMCLQQCVLVYQGLNQWSLYQKRASSA